MDITQRSLLRDLILAAEQNDRERVTLLLEMGVRADMPSAGSGFSAFHAAVEAGHVEMVRSGTPCFKSFVRDERYYDDFDTAYETGWQVKWTTNI
jgi:hypothetical protein